MEKELNFLGKVLTEPDRPFVAIIGGSKISGKIDVIDNLLDKADTLLIGGGMAYTFLNALGQTTGKSLIEADKIDVAKAALDKAKAKGVKLLLPIDHVLADKFAADAKTQIFSGKGAFPADWMALDIGPATIDLFAKEIADARTILWNGPMGVFELAPFAHGTNAIAELVAANRRRHQHRGRRRLGRRGAPGRGRRQDHPHLHRRRREPRIPRRQDPAGSGRADGQVTLRSWHPCKLRSPLARQV